ncbi:DUF3558 domain-containing protein [Nocardia sp. alder85J]|uniref:DUF3558 domain-containing protein n=1 Tax=Nocardia sp. alder85J TaxID=2862949 RepID=UPI001CD48896|nr:DUF3558 domain-containing protein [Nocardia sp. alder85J]MCX4097839.1 DUF3558 domain-containing protein [Nocardia sp. alder85J]
MQKAHLALLAATGVLTLAACGHGSDSAATHSTTTGPAASETEAPAPQTTVPPTGPGDVSCGRVTDTGGVARTVIAVHRTAGLVDCAQAMRVVGAYVAQSDLKKTVDGWDCRAQPSAKVPSVCTKDGLMINLLPN